MPTPQEIETLIASAIDARTRAYAPYSAFLVGAALLGADGRIYQGCNVENSSYSVTCCAERVALFTAVAAGCREFHAIAVVSNLDMTPPCGVCRQALADFAPELPVILASLDGAHRITTLDALLPERFSAHFLER